MRNYRLTQLHELVKKEHLLGLKEALIKNEKEEMECYFFLSSGLLEENMSYGELVTERLQREIRKEKILGNFISYFVCRLIHKAFFNKDILGNILNTNDLFDCVLSPEKISYEERVVAEFYINDNILISKKDSLFYNINLDEILLSLGVRKEDDNYFVHRDKILERLNRLFKFKLKKMLKEDYPIITKIVSSVMHKRNDIIKELSEVKEGLSFFFMLNEKIYLLDLQ